MTGDAPARGAGWCDARQNGIGSREPSASGPNASMPATGCSAGKLQGHHPYFSVIGNARALGRLHYEFRREWYKWLNRRSWQTRLNWARLDRLSKNFRLPSERLVHSFYGRVTNP